MGINLQPPELKDMKPRIIVIGVGGAGGNAINNMISSGLDGVEFIAANTDTQALLTSSAEQRIQLGATLTEGLGAGAKPEIGEAAAEEALDEIRTQITGAHMVFIACGMGGGTGTGAASVIARVARDEGILTVGVVTKPFQFEGSRRMRIAEAGIAEMKKYVDTQIVIPNQNLFRIASEKTTFAEAFILADQVLYSGIACIVDLIVKEGLINLDFADVRVIMSGMGSAMMGMGEGEGERRAITAAEEAITNPLLDELTLKGARGLLVSIVGGTDLTLYEVEEAASRVHQEVHPDANIIVGASFDDTLKDRVRVSIVASGMDRVDDEEPVPAGDSGTPPPPQQGQDMQQMPNGAQAAPAGDVANVPPDAGVPGGSLFDAVKSVGIVGSAPTTAVAAPPQSSTGAAAPAPAQNGMQRESGTSSPNSGAPGGAASGSQIVPSTMTPTAAATDPSLPSSPAQLVAASAPATTAAPPPGHNAASHNAASHNAAGSGQTQNLNRAQNQNPGQLNVQGRPPVPSQPHPQANSPTAPQQAQNAHQAPAQPHPETQGRSPNTALSPAHASGQGQPQPQPGASATSPPPFSPSSMSPPQHMSPADGQGAAWQAPGNVTIEDVPPQLSQPGKPMTSAAPAQPSPAAQPALADAQYAPQFNPAAPRPLETGLRKMPAVEDFPMVGQRDYRAKSTEPTLSTGSNASPLAKPAERPSTKKPGFFERLTGRRPQENTSGRATTSALPSGKAPVAQAGSNSSVQPGSGQSAPGQQTGGPVSGTPRSDATKTNHLSENHSNSTATHGDFGDNEAKLPMFFDQRKR